MQLWHGYIRGSTLYPRKLKIKKLQNKQNIAISVDASYDDDDGYSRNV